MDSTSPNYIDFASMSGFTLEAVISMITDCLRIAGSHQGRVFGGFVRDVIVPRLTSPSCSVKFKDVDIWFTKQEDADNFIGEMGEALVNHERWSNNKGKEYTFSKEQYFLYKNETCIAWVDIVVSPTIPVDDFNVNCLTFLYKGIDLPTYKSWNEETASALIEAIQTKKAIMLDSYAERIIHGPHYGCMSRIQLKFLDKGWRIISNVELPQRVTILWPLQSYSCTASSLTISPATNKKPFDERMKDLCDRLRVISIELEELAKEARSS